MAFCSIKVVKIFLAELSLARQSVIFSWNSINGITEWNKRQIIGLVFLSVPPRFLKLNSATWSLWWVKSAVWKCPSLAPHSICLSYRPSWVEVKLLQLRICYRYRATNSKDTLLISKTLQELLTYRPFVNTSAYHISNHYK